MVSLTGSRRDRQVDRPRGGGHAQARAPRARRQGAGRGLRRRRHGGRRRDDRRHRLLQRRPGLHGGHARARRLEGLRRRRCRASPTRPRATRPATRSTPRPTLGPAQLRPPARARRGLPGARARARGDRHRRRASPTCPGFFLEPTVVGGLRQDDEMIQREIFGPVITVQPFTDEAEAIAWANGTPYGLAVIGLDARRRPRAARRARRCASAACGSTTTSRSPPRCRTAASSSPATARTCRCTRSRTTRSSSTSWRTSVLTARSGRRPRLRLVWRAAALVFQPRRRAARRRLRLGPRPRHVQGARASRCASRSSASSRLRTCERASCATAVTRGPSFALIRAFWASLSASRRATSKMASIRDAVTLACWPPGPDEREARTSISESGTASPSRMRRESVTGGGRLTPIEQNFPHPVQLQSPGRQRQEPQLMEASAIHAPAALSRFPLGGAAAAAALRRAAARAVPRRQRRGVPASCTTATASGCSPTCARCCPPARARTPRTCCRTCSCAPTARCATTRAR